MTRITLSPSMQKPATVAVFHALEAAGGQGCVRFVGGCVRNALLGRDESDLDLSTQLVPDEVEAALDRARIKHAPTGKAFGTITAVVDGEPYEITSLREDVETDGRRAVVSFTTDWAKDAVRRDFYINALYADLSGQVYDPTGHGLEDAEAKRVRFIGEAEQRVREDYLRILRFFRFTASYASTIDAPSLAACVALKQGIDGLSGERIWQELIKLASTDAPSGVIEVIKDQGILPHVWPVVGDVDLKVFKQVKDYFGELWFHICGTYHYALTCLAALLPLEATDQDINNLQTRLKLSNREAAHFKNIVEERKREWDTDTQSGLRAIKWRGADGLDLLFLKAAQLGLSVSECWALNDRLEKTVLPVFRLKGADLLKLGMTPGPEVGERLKAIEAEWVAHDFSQSVIDAALDDLGGSNKK